MKNEITDKHQANKHGFSGSCLPGESAHRLTFATFSVGIFEWVPKASAKGLKKSLVKVRVQGPRAEPELVLAKAREICALLDAGIYIGSKTVKV